MPQKTEPSKPPTAEQLRNAAKAARRIINEAMSGGDITVPRDVATDREATCLSCEFYRHSDKSCSQCGCFIIAKTKLATESCPQGYWGAENKREATYSPVNGDDILEKELELRGIISGDGMLAQYFNMYQQEEKNGGCSSCRKRKFKAKFEQAFAADLSRALPAVVRQAQGVFPGTTHLLTPKPKTWNDILKYVVNG